jgi:hypothetical protein
MKIETVYKAAWWLMILDLALMLGNMLWLESRYTMQFFIALFALLLIRNEMRCEIKKKSKEQESNS